MNFKLKKILGSILKIILGATIKGKPLINTGSILYYEQAQHLLFLFKNILTYEPIVQQKVSKYISNSYIIFDIGGNIGQYALLFSKLSGEEGKVITFEPDYKNYAFLHFNININNLKNVTCIQQGVSDIATTHEFYRDTETGGRRGSFNVDFVGENFQGFKEQVKTTTLDEVIDKFGEPNFVKIDVEGFESNVIRGLSKSLQKTVFLIEVRKETKKEIFEYFFQRGYNCLYVDKKDDVKIQREEEIPNFANLIFIPS